MQILGAHCPGSNPGPLLTTRGKVLKLSAFRLPVWKQGCGRLLGDNAGKMFNKISGDDGSCGHVTFCEKQCGFSVANTHASHLAVEAGGPEPSSPGSAHAIRLNLDMSLPFPGPQFLYLLNGLTSLFCSESLWFYAQSGY